LHRDLALSQDFAGMPEVCRIGADLIWRRKLLQRLHKHLLQGLPGRRGANRFVRGFTGLFWRRRRAPAAACLAQANPHALAQADPPAILMWSCFCSCAGHARRSCMVDDDEKERLKDCLATVQNLKEENQQLRRAAASFGKLAERLNEALAERTPPPGSRSSS
jgi:hypothetical protein